MRGDLETSWELTGGVVDGVRSTGGQTRGGGRLLSKLNRAIQSSWPLTESRSSSTFYSQLTRGFGWDLILWIVLHEFYNFGYKIKA